MVPFFSLASFKILFSIVFRSSIVMCPDMGFFGLSCLAFTWFLYTSIGLCLLSDLRSFQPLYLWALFWPHLLYPLSGALMAPHPSPARMEVKAPHLTFTTRWQWCLAGVKAIIVWQFSGLLGLSLSQSCGRRQQAFDGDFLFLVCPLVFLDCWLL